MDGWREESGGGGGKCVGLCHGPFSCCLLSDCRQDHHLTQSLVCFLFFTACRSGLQSHPRSPDRAAPPVFRLTLTLHEEITVASFISMSPPFFDANKLRQNTVVGQSNTWKHNVKGVILVCISQLLRWRVKLLFL